MRARVRSQHGPSARRLVVLGFVVLTGMVGALALGYRAQDGVPWKDTYVVRAEVRDAANMARHDPVRIAGRRVGQISDLDARGGRAVLELTLERSVAPLRSDTVAWPRARSVLGQHFLELVPGKTGTPLADGALLPAARSREVIELDQVLSTFDRATRARTRELLATLGEGTTGRGVDTATTLGTAPGLLRDVRTTARALNRPDAPAEALVAGASAVASAVDPVRRELATGFAPEARVLGAVRQEGDAVRAALDAAPPALAAVAGELRPARRLLGALRHLAVDARPLLRAAPDGLDELARLLPVAGPGLAALRPTLTTLDEVAPDTLRLLRELRPLTGAALASLRDGGRALSDLARRPCHLRRWLRTWGGEDGLVSFRNEAGGFARFTFAFPEAPFTGVPTTSVPTTPDAYPDPSACREAAR